jgi:hypothetical protein
MAYPTGDATRPNTGNRTNVGFLIGQQYDMKTGAALQSRVQGEALAYTPEIKLVETGANLEVTGIRVFKYLLTGPILVHRISEMILFISGSRM